MSIKLPKIFLDSGDPLETKKTKGIVGLLDGQTTNPSLVFKNPEVQQHISQGKKLTETELLSLYKNIIQDIAKEIAGPISTEVYADWSTSAGAMLKQADEMYQWGNNIYIKFPNIPEGLKAANEFVKKGGRVNMTLVFDQSQAAAAYSATLSDSVESFVSPFIGRLDDKGYRGIDLVKNIIKTYKKFDKQLRKKRSHIKVLAASIRNLNHFYACIFLGADILTVPLKILEEWVENEKWVPDEHYRMDSNGLKSIRFENLPFHTDYSKYAVTKKDGDILDEGINKFINDWKSLLNNS